MLKTLIVHNYSLIEQLNINFQNGFSVITGETGAGKSIILGALGLLLGVRADSKTIRHGESKCIIEGHFSLNSNKLKDFFDDNDFEFEPEDCIIRREIYASGKSRAFINDTPAQLTQLKELGEQLIDIHSQHKNLLLNNEGFQLEVLDTIAHNHDLLVEYKRNYLSYKALQQELENLKEQARKNKEEEDYLNFQFNQLDEANLEPDEQEQLEEELDILSHSEEIKASLYSCNSLLQDSEDSVLCQLRNIQSHLRNIDNYFAPTKEWLERIESSYIELKDISDDIEGKGEDVEYNPKRMEYVNERLNTIYTLEKKHNKESVAELLELKELLQKKLDLINNSDEQILLFTEKLRKQKETLSSLAKKLSEKRKSGSETLVSQMTATLSNLGMPNVQFRIELKDTKDFRSNGTDEVCYLFNANKGGKLQELSQIASGGEIARVMLSLKSLMAGASDLPTLIFDEIDTGVSGSIAEKMAIIMKQMCESENRQVISITHLPQIASRGTVHYKVFKEDKENETLSHIVALKPEERVHEIAHMLSGENLTEAAINNAKELLRQK